jgi:hypothetical protein
MKPKNLQRKTIIRRSDEPKLEIGNVVQIKEGIRGVVVARYVKSGDESGDVHDVVELRPDGDFLLSHQSDCYLHVACPLGAPIHLCVIDNIGDAHQSHTANRLPTEDYTS